MSRVIRLVTVLLPIACAVALTMFVGPSLYRGHGVLGALPWLVQLIILSTATVLVVDHFARRLVPLGGLFNLSLVFPDEAPSRFSVALRAGSTKRLSAELEERRPDETEGEAATRLLAMVADLNRHDRLTRGHTERVRAYSDLIAEELDLSQDDRWKLRWAVLLHDIGKLVVPPEILNKDGKPTDEEWAILRGHPAAGAEMVEPLAGWLGDWRLAAGQHHERWDGKGYPNQLAGEEISLAGRIVAVADAYDVITSIRSYKRATDPAAARQELVRCAGTQFDPAIVRAFLNVSLGKLRLVGGPLAWLASLPNSGNLPTTVASAATNAAVAGSVLLSTLVGAAATLPSTPARDVLPPAAAATTDGTAGSAGGSGSGPPGSDGSSAGSGSSPDAGAATSSQGTGSTTTLAAGASAGGPAAGLPGSGSSVAPGSPGPVGSPGSPAAGSGGSATGATTTTGRSGTTTGTSPTSPPLATTTTKPATTTTKPAATTTTAAVPPTLVADSFSVVTSVQADFNVLANDINGSKNIVPSSLAITSPPSHAASYSVHNHQIRYQSASGYVGTDTIGYEACDSSGLCGTATLTITVTS